MARLIIPEDFTSQLTLLANIVSQNTTLGADSPLTAFLTQQNIVLADDVTAGVDAQMHETSRALLSRQSENFRQMRDNLFKTPWQHTIGSAQFLKSFYKGNTKQLGTWGFTITDSGKINYAPAFTDRVAVFYALTRQNNSYAAGSSPLQPYLTQQNINLETDAGFADQATGNDQSFTSAAQQSENETELRNQIWLPVLAHIKAIGNFLMKLYQDNEKALGLWGFVVDHSAQQPRQRISKINPGETAVFNGLIIGGTLTNIGTGEIHLYRGKSTTGTPVIIHAGEQFGIMKGYSSVTIVNPSTLTEAKITALTAA